MRAAMLGVKRKQWEPFAFASPSLVLIALIIVFPLVYSFYLSLQNFDLSVGADYEYVGAKNYVEALTRDPRFLGSVWTTAVLIAPSLALELMSTSTGSPRRRSRSCRSCWSRSGTTRPS